MKEEQSSGNIMLVEKRDRYCKILKMYFDVIEQNSLSRNENEGVKGGCVLPRVNRYFLLFEFSLNFSQKRSVYTCNGFVSPRHMLLKFWIMEKNRIPPGQTARTISHGLQLPRSHFW